MLFEALLTDLLFHVALFCMVAVALSRLAERLETAAPVRVDAATGLAFGFLAVASMLAPVQIAEGVVFDGRAIAVAAAGLFGGPIGAVVAVAPPALYRIELGGAGLLPGLINLALSAALGAGVRWRAQRTSGDLTIGHIAAAACLLPFASYLAIPFFPTAEMAWRIFHDVSLALAIAMPAGLFLLGALLLNERRRQKLTTQLRANEAIFKTLSAEMPAMLFQRSLTADGMPQFQFITESSRRLLDRTPEDLYRDPGALIEAIHPDDRQNFLTTIRAAEAAGVMPIHEYRSVSREGFVRWLRVSAMSSWIDGQYRWSGVTIDVTKLKEAERQQNELAQIVRDSAVAIIRTDPEFNVRYFNAAAEKLYGYASAEVIGSPAAVFRPPERVDAMAPLLAELIATRKPGSIRTTSLHKSGRRIPTRLDISPLFDESGELSGWSAMCIDMTEQRRAEEELERLATTDSLTGIANRRSFTDRAAQEVGRARRYKRPLALIMADVDFFKRINDTHGHAVGDVVLKEVSRVIADTLRTSSDFAARLGGEEFAMLLPECDLEGAALLAERLRIAIAGLRIRAGETDVAVRCSFGVSEWHPAEASIESGLQRADAALYTAKSEGRDRVAVSDRPTGLSAVQTAAARPAH